MVEGRKEAARVWSAAAWLPLWNDAPSTVGRECPTRVPADGKTVAPLPHPRTVTGVGAKPDGGGDGEAAAGDGTAVGVFTVDPPGKGITASGVRAVAMTIPVG